MEEEKIKTKDEPWITDAEWSDPNEGQLAVDVIETNKTIKVRSAIAGVKQEDLDIFVTTDTVTIRGKRESCSEDENETYHIKECHFGGFSRSVVLPAHVRADEAEAVLKNGILTITLPKTKLSSNVSVIEID
ncbi:MAG: Hsp20/alpha crystallin family protein [Candidatus Uhrbacteria bacterium]|nr:Hsp20/alpha crystallin family protein [Patescibacteria group bacterium]MBU1906901.1 Hsp20/alpha crystallin family protein [Patescibacteria group bacterium]